MRQFDCVVERPVCTVPAGKLRIQQRVCLIARKRMAITAATTSATDVCPRLPRAMLAVAQTSG